MAYLLEYSGEKMNLEARKEGEQLPEEKNFQGRGNIKRGKLVKANPGQLLGSWGLMKSKLSGIVEIPALEASPH